MSGGAPEDRRGVPAGSAAHEPAGPGDAARRLVLGSASPRRRDLLEAIGLPHDVRPSRAEEPPTGRWPPSEHVERSSLVKGREVARRHPDRLVLAADTVVALGDGPSDVLGKPADAREARRMLELLSGREHRVLTGVALLRSGDAGVETSALSVTRVRFRRLTPRFVERYVESGEPLDKAGAYGAQGRMGAWVERIEGSWTNVVGLPLELLPGLFEDAGEDLTEWLAWKARGR